MQPTIVKAQCKFVSHRKGKAKKTGDSYNFVELSNGLQSETFGVDKDDDTDYSQFTSGDDVTASFLVDPMKKSYNISLVGLE